MLGLGLTSKCLNVYIQCYHRRLPGYGFLWRYTKTSLISPEDRQTEWFRRRFHCRDCHAGVQRRHLYCSEAIRSTVFFLIAAALGTGNVVGQAVSLSCTKSSDRGVVTPYADAARGEGSLSLS